MQELIFVSLGVAAAVLMAYFHRAHRRDMRLRRRAMFDEVLANLKDPDLRQEGIGFPVLDGRYRDHFVRIEPIEEHVGFRKVPSMWLRISVMNELPYRGVFDYLIRPENIEFYSPIGRLPHHLEVPAEWPQQAWLRTDDPETMPPLERVAPHMRFFDDPRAKELMITRRGVRLVYQVHQAERPYYLVLRSVTFEDLNVPWEEAHALLDRAIAIAEDLGQENEDE
jgi:hypothetical protein